MQMWTIHHQAFRILLPSLILAQFSNQNLHTKNSNFHADSPGPNRTGFFCFKTQKPFSGNADVDHPPLSLSYGYTLNINLILLGQICTQKRRNTRSNGLTGFGSCLNDCTADVVHPPLSCLHIWWQGPEARSLIIFEQNTAKSDMG
jgi:hypothetical protein